MSIKWMSRPAIQLVNANHQPVDQEVVRVTVPKRRQ